MQMKFTQMKIEAPSADIYKRVKENWDHIAKPLDGLGQFEELIAQIGAIQRTEWVDIDKKAVIVMCADNGVVAQNVSQSGQDITALVTKAMGQGSSSVGKMAAALGMDVFPVDIGVNSEERFPGVTVKKVARGTADFTKEPAMTEAQAETAIQTGIDMVRDLRKQGYGLLATGEMGIGNTTTSSAMAAALMNAPVSQLTGRGAGLDDERLTNKIAVIEYALKTYQLRAEETFRILCCVGGLDIAGLTGVFLGGAIYHVPIVTDGVISLVAALTAERLVPGTSAYMLPSHKSREPAAQKMLKELKLHPVIDAALALGEGTGAVMLCSLLELAMALYKSDTTFFTMTMDDYKRF